MSDTPGGSLNSQLTELAWPKPAAGFSLGTDASTESIMEAMVSPDDGFVVNPDELMDIVTTLARVGSDLSNGLQKTRDGLMLTQAVGLGWEVDAPLAHCAAEWLEQMLDLNAAISRASENLARTAQCYLDAEGGFSPMLEEEQ